MSIPEERIMKHLEMLLTSTDPGDAMHHMHVIHAPAGAVNMFGLSDPETHEAAVFAIAPDQTVVPEQFVAATVRRAAADLASRGHVALFVALSQEMWAVEPMDALGIKLKAEGRLDEHPNVAELTLVYAVAADGRRWRGRRWVTGPRAGEVIHPDTLVGQPTRDEAWGIPAAPLMRRLVGMAG